MKLLVVLAVIFLAAQAAKHKKSKMASLKTGSIERRAELTVPGECRDFEYRCKNNKCIQLEWTCDTDNDCGDGSDELDCPQDCSGSHQFQCGSAGACIPSEYRCDGDSDCTDHSDEDHCDTVVCSAAEIKCSNNICIETAYMCDGDNDCGNGWDEVTANCNNI